mgnify:CR=1 FL=1
MKILIFGQNLRSKSSGFLVQIARVFGRNRPSFLTKLPGFLVEIARVFGQNCPGFWSKSPGFLVEIARTPEFSYLLSKIINLYFSRHNLLQRFYRCVFCCRGGRGCWWFRFLCRWRRMPIQNVKTQKRFPQFRSALRSRRSMSRFRGL